MAEENAKLAKEKASREKKAAAAADPRSAKKARKSEKEEETTEKAARPEEEFGEVEGFRCKRCTERGLECKWPLMLDGTRSRACYPCVRSSQGCQLGDRMISKVPWKEHPRTLAGKASGQAAQPVASGSGQGHQPEASGSGARAEDEESSEDDYLERTAAVCLKELVQIRRLLVQAALKTEVTNRRLERIALNTKLMAERGDEVYREMYGTLPATTPTSVGEAMEEDEVEVLEEAAELTGDEGAEAEGAEAEDAEKESEGKGKEKVQ